MNALAVPDSKHNVNFLQHLADNFGEVLQPSFARGKNTRYIFPVAGTVWKLESRAMFTEGRKSMSRFENTVQNSTGLSLQNGTIEYTIVQLFFQVIEQI